MVVFLGFSSDVHRFWWFNNVYKRDFGIFMVHFIEVYCDFHGIVMIFREFSGDFVVSCGCFMELIPASSGF